MPELPEVETTRRSLEPHLLGKRIDAVRVYDRRLRVPVRPAELERAARGARVMAIRRRAKYLLVDLEGDKVLLIHLGMSGRLWVGAADTGRRPHDHIVLDLEGGRQLRFNDPRRFGLFESFGRVDEAAHPRLVDLGLEPLGSEFDAAALVEMCRGRDKPIKNLLMDGSLLVGVGNIYACESLYTARIDPRVPARRLGAAQLRRLQRAIVATLERAIADGGTTLKDFADADGQAGYFAVRLRVYDRAGEKCRRCGLTIRRFVQAGRATFFCAGCQTGK